MIDMDGQSDRPSRSPSQLPTSPPFRIRDEHKKQFPPELQFPTPPYAMTRKPIGETLVSRYPHHFLAAAISGTQFAPYGQVAYEAYKLATGGKTFDDKPMLEWYEVPEHINNAWETAAHAVIDQWMEDAD